MKRQLKILAGIFAGWALLLVLLLAAETRAGNSNFHGLGDALWFSLVTLTTVGYGDISPVSPLGRIVGGVFVLFSTGLMTVLIGLVLSVMTGRLFPELRLRLRKNHKWYLFLGHSPAGNVLAQQLLQRDPENVIISWDEPIQDGILLPEELTPERVLSLKAGRADAEVFLMGENGWENWQIASSLPAAHCYCRTEYTPNSVPDNITLFTDADCCARSYWQQYPLEPAEKTVVLIGSGRYAQKLLERALLINVFSRERTTEYHVFGDYTGFRNSHYRLGDTVSVNQKAENQDALFFHSEGWDSDPELLRRADRIAFCGEGEMLEDLGKLRSYFVVTGRVFLRSASQAEGAISFGTLEELYTLENVMHTRLNRLAKGMHENYCASVPGAPTWEQLSEFLRQSNIAAADHILTKLRLLLPEQDIRNVTGDACREAVARFREQHQADPDRFREMEHRRWMRFHSMHNWQYASVRNNALREHPLMVPYEALALEEQKKDDYAWNLLEQLTELADG